MTAKLIAEEGTLKGFMLSFEDGEEWTIGSDPANSQLVIETPLIAAKHAFCRRAPEGIFIENLSESDPVQVNDQDIQSPHLLKKGDIVKIGNEKFRFQEDEKSLADEWIDEDKEADTIFDETEENNGLADINFDFIDAGRWLLKVIGGPNHGAEFSMHASSSFVIGTDPNSCDIVFHDTSVSRQHARITIAANDQITIEDLKSRNGTLIDGIPLKGKKTLTPNAIIGMGTTTFVIYDREGEMHTIISPLLPSIVKVLQKEEPKKEEARAAEKAAAKTMEELPKQPLPSLVKTAEKTSQMGSFLFIGMLTGVLVIVGIGAATLFKSQPVVLTPEVDSSEILKEALKNFPSVKYTFNKSSGRLLLVGHVLTNVDKNQLLAGLQGLSFIKSIDDTGVIIDEGVWQETNQVLSKNPMWKGISIHSPAPGKFILAGMLQTRKQAEQLSDYITSNFPYLDLLEKHLIVEEDVTASIKTILEHYGMPLVNAQMSNGEVILKGTVPHSKQEDVAPAINEIKAIPGVRIVRNYITEAVAEDSLVNLTDKYEVSGSSRLGNSLSVVINGRILSKGDELDGMTITEIKSNTILLERDGTHYKIDFGR